MGAGIASSGGVAPDAAALATGPAVLGLASSDWDRAAVRVESYLRAMGVRDPREIALLREQVRQRAEARAAAMPLEDAVEAAIEETGDLLDRWLNHELGHDSAGVVEPDALCAARAAVLGGSVPGWSARWAGLSETPLGAAIQSARLAPVPERAPLVMEPNPIHLCCHRLRLRLAALRDWLLGRSVGRADTAGGHS